MKNQTATELFQQVEKLLRDKDFTSAVSHLNDLQNEGLSPKESAYFWLLWSEANLYLGNSSINHELGVALEYYKNSADNVRFARAKFLQGWRFTLLGEYLDARETLLESFAGYKRCNHLKGQARTLNRLSYVLFQAGEIDAAAQRLRDCICIYNESGDIGNEIIVSMNLAVLYCSMGKLSDATELYQSIKQDILSHGPKIYGAYYSQLSVLFALKGNKVEARQINSLAAKFFKDFPREEAIRHENLGWIHLLEEDYRAAEEALQKGLEISLKIAPESALVSQIKRRLADACLGLGEYVLAREYADEALVVAQKINERVEIAACYRVYAQLDCRKGDHDAARTWFGKAFEMFTMIGSRYELAVTRYLAAISGLYLNGERQALLYMAREYFEREDVRQYVEKINSEIKRVRTISIVRPAGDNNQQLEIVTVNPEMQRLAELARHIAQSKMSVLLTGPTGSGKDLFARYIHFHSGRSGKFVPVNTAAIPDNMIEAELFGYRKGAYTGADQTTPGWIEEAEGGTIYLNEIADATPGFQAKLLDVIERHQFCRLGDRHERRVDFRVIAASNHDIDQLIQNGRFRPDLYHRLNEIPFILPPLVDRREDIPALLRYFLRLSGISYSAKKSREAVDRLAEILRLHDWPGNVRELKARVERLILMSGSDVGRMVEMAQESIQSERDRLLALLEKTHWNRTQVARILGISEGAVRHRIKKYNLNAAGDL